MLHTMRYLDCDGGPEYANSCHLFLSHCPCLGLLDTLGLGAPLAGAGAGAGARLNGRHNLLVSRLLLRRTELTLAASKRGTQASARVRLCLTLYTLSLHIYRRLSFLSATQVSAPLRYAD